VGEQQCETARSLASLGDDRDVPLRDDRRCSARDDRDCRSCDDQSSFPRYSNFTRLEKKNPLLRLRSRIADTPRHLCPNPATTERAEGASERGRRTQAFLFADSRLSYHELSALVDCGGRSWGRIQRLPSRSAPFAGNSHPMGRVSSREISEEPGTYSDPLNASLVVPGRRRRPAAATGRGPGLVRRPSGSLMTGFARAALRTMRRMRESENNGPPAEVDEMLFGRPSVESLPGPNDSFCPSRFLPAVREEPSRRG